MRPWCARPLALVAFVILVRRRPACCGQLRDGAIARCVCAPAAKIPALSVACWFCWLPPSSCCGHRFRAGPWRPRGALVVIAPVWSRRLVDRGRPAALTDARCSRDGRQAPLVRHLRPGQTRPWWPIWRWRAVSRSPCWAALRPCWSCRGRPARRVLIRFTGPKQGRAARRIASGACSATVPVAAGLPGVLVAAPPCSRLRSGAGAGFARPCAKRWRWPSYARFRLVAVRAGHPSDTIVRARLSC